MTSITQISVVIPTYDRSDALRLTLQALAAQTLPLDAFEVILVDDGSTEDLQRMIVAENLPFPLRFFQQTHRGPAAARNLGAREARGDVLLFLDSDMIAAPELLSRHLESHLEPSRLVIGPRSCYTRTGKMDPLDFYDYRPDGSDMRLDKSSITFQEAFTCNLSIKKIDWHHLGGFDEELSSFEDVEFAYRAQQNGMQIVSNPSALAFHDHNLDFRERCLKAAVYARSVPQLYQKHPELRSVVLHLRDKEPIAWGIDSPILVMRKLARCILTFGPVLSGLERLFLKVYHRPALDRFARWLYWKVIAAYQWRGLRHGIEQYGWPKITEGK